MYKLEREKPSHRDDTTTIPRRRRTASFSSSLLDAIYRSIDESKADQEEEEEDQSRKSERQVTTKKKQSNTGFREVKENNNLRRAIMIESWVEKQSVQSSTLSNSASSSSESVWSSSETDSSLKQKSNSKAKKPEKKQSKPEPRCSESKQSPNPRVFSKTKLKAMKIYGELKKVKQPISPGGRIASFLNSIFNSGNVKKAKMCYVGAVEDVTSEHVSKPVCSSSSTILSRRSCLSKPQSSSRPKHGNNGNKRSVRFYPVSVILGEDSQPCGHKCVYEDDPSLMPLSTIRSFVKSSSLKGSPVKGKSDGREARSFLRSYRDNNGEADDEDDEDDDDDDDAESYSSSDLFELDHVVGIGRYREELPVYETTNLKTNQAIAKGLIL